MTSRKLNRLLPILLAMLGILLALFVLPGSSVKANRMQLQNTQVCTATRRLARNLEKTSKPIDIDATPTVYYRAITTIPRLCGRLVFLEDQKTGQKDIGLIPCTGGEPYIFRTHPREIVDFYQFRDAKIYQGPKFCTVQYGCLDKYIYTFKNYIGIENCRACGDLALPTWTQAPLTPYTSTPIPPTATQYVPSPTATSTPTLQTGQVTDTPGLFELLRTPPTLLPSAAVTTTPAGPQAGPSLAGQAVVSSGSQPWNSPLVLGVGFVLVMLGLAYFVWLSVMREDDR